MKKPQASPFKVGEKVVATESTAVAIKAGCVYTVTAVSHKGHHIAVDGNAAHICVEKFKPLPAPNGTDTYGDPLNFSKSDLELFMRVRDGRGNPYVVVPNTKNGVVFENSHGVLTDFETESPLTSIQEVYEAPLVVQVKLTPGMLDPCVYGKLVWKRKPIKTKLDIAIENAEEEIERIQEDLKARVKTLDKLRNRVQ